MLKRRKSLVDIDNSRSRYDAFIRHTVVTFAQTAKNCVLDTIERRVVTVSALCRLHAIAILITVKMRYAKARPGANNTDRTSLWQVRVRSGKMDKLFFRRAGRGMCNGSKVIDDCEPPTSQLLFDKRRSDDPGIIGETD